MKNMYSQKETDILNYAEMNKNKWKNMGIEYCTVEDERYPNTLKKITDRPVLLYYRGNIEIINEYHNIAVIGSRKCSLKGRKISYDTGKYLAEKNVNVVNGLALGCDTEALKGTIAGGGRCIGILPAGLDDILPKSNQKLADEIVMKDGCLISEYPVGTPVKKYQYVRRDRLQSGLSDGVLIVEAEEQSGTMHTVEFAQNQYKRLACYYHKLVELSSGNRKLEEAGQISVIEDKKRLEEFVEAVMKEQTYEQLTLFKNEREIFKMSKHTERAKELRSEVPVSSNCAQTVMRVYAKEIGLDEDLAAAIGSNFGGGMRCGATCGAIAAGYMVLGAKGIESPAVLNEFRKCIAKKHDGMTDCADLLRANAAKGGEKKPHCDNMIEEVITLIDELTDGR